MKYFAILFLFFASACALKPNYYEVSPYIKIPPADKVLIDGKEVKNYEKGSTQLEVGTSFFDRKITLINGDKETSYLLKTKYVPARGAGIGKGNWKFISHTKSNDYDTLSPLFLLLPVNTFFGIIPAVGSLAFGIAAQPFILINDIGLFNKPDYSLHGKAFEPFFEFTKEYNGLIVQDVINIVNFPVVLYHNKLRQNGELIPIE